LASSTILGSPDERWQIYGTGDFNGDGTDAMRKRMVAKW
jgi:hypothetical protein